MEFKKCARCGCFFVSTNNVCCNCESQDKRDIAKLNSFLDNTFEIGSAQELSSSTGVTLQNINRFISDNSITGINFKL